MKLPTEDTIAAIVTPLGVGGLGVIRLSGHAALAVADRVFRAKNPLSSAASHTLHHGALHDGEILDDAVASVFRAPRSYTGEDVVELSCHGSPSLLRRVLAACLAAGARGAEAGEFTRRAFLNGKMDLAQAEAVALLISARSEDARRWALEQLQGGLSARLKEFRAGLLRLLAQVEANLDFAEEEVPDLSREELTRRTEDLRRGLETLLATAPRGRAFRDGLRAALVGRPNVGKSSLFNALLGADRAIVADAPGTTRDVLEEHLAVRGLPLVLTDTAGLRPGAEAVESEGIRRARRALAQADVALWVMDAAEPLTPADAEAARDLAGRPAVAVFNKEDLVPSGIDKMGLTARARALLPALKGAAFVSAKTGEGLEELRSLLAAAADVPAREASEGPTLINDRHEALVREAAAALKTAAAAARAGEPDECLSLDLRRALDALGRVTGEGVTDEVLNAVFSNFCIGK